MGQVPKLLPSIVRFLDAPLPYDFMAFFAAGVFAEDVALPPLPPPKKVVSFDCVDDVSFFICQWKIAA
jgi:hypothetical protein